MESWEPRDRTVLQAITRFLQARVQGALSRNCFHLKGHGGTKGALDMIGSLLRGRCYPFVARSDARGYYANIRHRILRRQHPDKTFIGKVSHGFDFLGVDFQPGEESQPSAVSQTRLQEKLHGHFTHAARLYEQGRLKSLETIERYLSHWLRWAKGLRLATSNTLDAIRQTLLEICRDTADVMIETFT